MTVGTDFSLKDHTNKEIHSYFTYPANVEERRGSLLSLSRGCPSWRSVRRLSASLVLRLKKSCCSEERAPLCSGHRSRSWLKNGSSANMLLRALRWDIISVLEDCFSRQTLLQATCVCCVLWSLEFLAPSSQPNVFRLQWKVKTQNFLLLVRRLSCTVGHIHKTLCFIYPSSSAPTHPACYLHPMSSLLFVSVCQQGQECPATHQKAKDSSWPHPFRVWVSTLQPEMSSYLFLQC